MSASVHYDLVVIGGGSGGLACSKAAAKLGKKVAVCDFVQPSPPGTTWGLGGTCVNVGCIPKKLMHNASLIGDLMKDAPSFGWDVAPDPKHNWETMVNNVQMHIKSLNFGYRAELMSNAVKYYNAFATFTDPHTVQALDKKGKTTTLTADQFVVAVGGRPKYPDIPGAKEHCVTSDDIFSMKTPPGKTLVVGASYVALECAGFIKGTGFETTVMMRSIPLRGFDQQMAEIVKRNMETEHGVSFIEKATPSAVELAPSGKKLVKWKYTDGTTGEAEFDTVLLAVGREVCTGKMGLETTGVTISSNGKIPTTHEQVPGRRRRRRRPPFPDPPLPHLPASPPARASPSHPRLPLPHKQTNVPHIFAIGDVIDGDKLQPPSNLTELTPVAIQAGKHLAKRLYGQSSTAADFMDYQQVPTTVYTPLEYGAVGLSEEEAEKKYGPGGLDPNKGIEVYHTYFTPLEWTVPHRGENAAYAKVICDKADNERVVGLHIAGPGAGEMVQGFAVALKCGATKAHFDQTVGIHPTNAEQFTTLHVTKASGDSAEQTGC